MRPGGRRPGRRLVVDICIGIGGGLGGGVEAGIGIDTGIGIGAQKGAVRVGEYRCGVDADLVGEELPRTVEPVQRVRLPARPGQDQHQLRHERLSQRVRGGLGAQHGRGGSVVAQLPVRARQRLHGRQTQLLQRVRGRLQRCAVHGPGERRTLPQPQCLAQDRHGLGRVRAPPDEPERLLEPVGIHECFGQAQPVRRSLGEEFHAVCFRVVLCEDRPEPGDVSLQHGARVPRRFLVPQCLGESLDADGRVRVGQQHGEQAPSFGRAEREGSPVRRRYGDRPQHAELHRPHPCRSVPLHTVPSMY